MVKINDASIPVFDGQDGGISFDDWADQIHQMISGLGAADALSPHPREYPDNVSSDTLYLIEEKRLKAEREAFYVLFTGLSLDQRVLRGINRNTNMIAAQLWYDLHTDYGTQSAARIRILEKQYNQAQIEDNENVAKYMARLKSYTNQLRAGNVIITTNQILSKVIGDVERIPYYQTPILAFQAKALKDQTVEAFLDYFLLYETNHPRPSARSSSSTHALSAKWKNRDQKSSTKNDTCQFCNKTGHKKSQCFSYQRSIGNQPNNKPAHAANNNKKKYCSFHKSHGHDTKDCRDKPKPAAHHAAAFNGPDYAAAFMTIANTSSKEHVLMDSGATHHMSANKHYMINYKTLEKPTPVHWGNSSSDYARGMGDIEFTSMVNGRRTKSVFKDVLHVPQLSQSTLISMGQIVERGGIINTLPNKNLAVHDSNNNLIFTCIKRNNLYYLDIQLYYELDSDTDEDTIMEPAYALASNTKTAKPRAAPFTAPTSIHDDIEMEPIEEIETNDNTIVPPDGKKTSVTDLWHYRFAHSSIPIIKQAVKPHDIHLGEPTFCDICPLGKIKRKSFKPRIVNSSDVLDIIHSDLLGPLQESMAKAQYAITFTDDYSRFSMIYLLPNKSAQQLLHAFKTYHNIVTTQHNRPIKHLQSDNGGEYVNQAVQEFCEDHGIQQRLTASHTPQSNGVAERLNQTIANATRCMLFSARLPDYFWGEAIAAATHLRNMLPTTTSTGSFTPWNRWYQCDPPIKNLRIWGSPVYTKINRPGLTKLEERAKLGIFVGYTMNKDLYRVYIPEQHKVIIARDLIFNEEAIMHHESNRTNPRPQLRMNFELADSDSDSDYIPLRFANPIPVVPVQQPRIAAPTPPLAPAIVPDTPAPRPSSSAKTTPTPFIIKTFEKLREQNKRTETRAHARRERLAQMEILSRPNSPTEIQLREILLPKIPEESDTTLLKQTSRRTKMTSKQAPTAGSTSTGLSAHAYSAFSATVNTTVPAPTTIDEAMQSVNKREWQDAVYNEIKNLEEHNTYQLVPLPSSHKAIPCRWVFSTKMDSNNNITQFKARLVIKGFHQVQGIDYTNVQSPVASLDTIRFLIAFSAANQLIINHIDVKGAFLNGDLDDVVYMQQPPGFVDLEHPNYVCKLSKALYGLKQASLAWFHTLRDFIISQQFLPCDVDPCLFIKDKGTYNCLILAIYVDDILIAATHQNSIDQFFIDFNIRFDSTNYKFPSLFLGIEFTKTDVGIALTQRHYVEQLLEIYNVPDSCGSSTIRTPKTPGNRGQICDFDTNHPPCDKTTYQALVGALLWISRGTRPDISFAVSWLGRYSHSPNTAHMSVAIQVLTYLAGTKHQGLHYRQGHMNIHGFTDSDFANSANRKSTGGFVFFLRIYDSPITWKSKLQSLVTRSVTEAEYIACANGCQEATWLGYLYQFLYQNTFPISIFIDNQSARSLLDITPVRQQTKQIDVNFHYCRDRQRSRHVNILPVTGPENPADIFTKAFNPSLFAKAHIKLDLDIIIPEDFAPNSKYAEFGSLSESDSIFGSDSDSDSN